MKKIIALLMTTMMMGTMVGCGSSSTKTADKGQLAVKKNLRLQW